MITKATLREILDYPPDYFGECDHCHDARPVWIDYDGEEIEAEFAFCQACWQSFARKK